jgi:TrpR-related protein YerC/YecD
MALSSLDPDTRLLLEAVASLRNSSEALSFFRDLLTQKEIDEITTRWKAARMLSEGRPYTEICKVTGLSSTTVARVSKWLKKGAGGYQLMLRRQQRR